MPANVAQPCPHPATFGAASGTVADDELMLGRVGDALIACGAQKAIAVGAYNKARAVLNNNQG